MQRFSLLCILFFGLFLANIGYCAIPTITQLPKLITKPTCIADDCKSFCGSNTVVSATLKDYNLQTREKTCNCTCKSAPPPCDIEHCTATCNATGKEPFYGGMENGVCRCGCRGSALQECTKYCQSKGKVVSGNPSAADVFIVSGTRIQLIPDKCGCK
jgi:hypothetical protein